MIPAPLLLRLGFSAIALVATCVYTIYQVKRSQPAFAAPQRIPQDDDPFRIDYTKECPICLKQIGREKGHITLPCDDVFHRCCIKNVFSVQVLNHNCPLCRRRVDSLFVETVLQA